MIALAITAAFFVVEVVGALLTNSLALLADAAHMLTDVGALALGLFAAWLASQPVSAQKTYGYYRTEILAALFNGTTLVLVCLYIFYEAYGRLSAPPEVQSLPMLAVAVLGLGANLASALVLGRSERHSLNIKAAFLHVIGDALGSAGVIIAALVMLFTGNRLADPVISILIGLLIIYGAGRLVLEAVDILMEACPSHISLKAVEEALKRVAGVISVHDLHVWTVTSGLVAMSGHVVVAGEADSQQVLRKLRAMLEQEFRIMHTTLQVEGHNLQDPDPLHW